jgi:hypothetical protein
VGLCWLWRCGFTIKYARKEAANRAARAKKTRKTALIGVGKDLCVCRYLAMVSPAPFQIALSVDLMPTTTGSTRAERLVQPLAREVAPEHGAVRTFVSDTHITAMAGGYGSCAVVGSC